MGRDDAGTKGRHEEDRAVEEADGAGHAGKNVGRTISPIRTPELASSGVLQRGRGRWSLPFLLMTRERATSEHKASHRRGSLRWRRFIGRRMAAQEGRARGCRYLHEEPGR